MRRLALFGIIGVVATACSWDSTSFDYQSTLYQRTNGVALKGYDGMYGGNRAQVGMNSLTCEVNLATSMLGNDYDYSGIDADQVHDAGLMGSDMVVLVTTPDVLHVQHTPGDYSDDGADDFGIPGVQSAKVTNDGVLAMYDDGANCGIQWVGGGDATRTFNAGGCLTDFTLTANPVSGTAFVGSDNGITHVTQNGTQVISEQASQLVAYDAQAEVLYTAEYGSMILRGLEADGTERFSTDVGAAILSIDDMGSRGAAVASISYADGTGGVVVVDGLTGAIESSQGTPSAVESIVGAPDGGSIALVDSDQVHFYRVGSFLTGDDSEASGLDPILGF